MTKLSRTVKLFLASVFAVGFVISSGFIARAAGGVDPAFTGNLYRHSGEFRASAVLSDGKVIVAGAGFSIVNGSRKVWIARINPDGTVDESFNSPDLTDPPNCSNCPIHINDVAVQPDGKILIGGAFRRVSGEFHVNTARLNADGSVDSSFSLNGLDNVTFGEVFDVELLANGKVVVAGSVVYSNRTNLIRLNSNGNLDETFDPGTNFFTVFAVKEQPDGKLVTVEGTNTPDGAVKRYELNGTRDNSFSAFTSGGLAKGLSIAPDGKIFVFGEFTSANGSPYGRAARLNSDGTTDTSFNSGGSGFNAPVRDAFVEAGGSIVAAGTFSSYNGNSVQRVIRLTPDGTVDTGFNYSPVHNLTPQDIKPLPGARYLLSGSIARPAGSSVTGGFATRLNSNGTDDPGFKIYSGGNAFIKDFALQSDGKILVAGFFHLSGNTIRDYVARLNQNGTLDASFSASISSTDTFAFDTSAANTVALQQDGKILVGGNISSGSILRLIRLNADGSTDTSFNTGLPASNNVVDIAIQPDGNVLASGGVDNHVRRFLSTGAVDPTFNAPQPTVNIGRTKLALQPDGKVLIAGLFNQIGGVSRGRIVRLNSDGTLDSSFNPGSGADNPISDLALQPDGKILIVGGFSTYNTFGRPRAARLNPDGSLDFSFSVDFGTLDPTIQPRSVLRQPDGRIVIGGNFNTINGQPRKNLARVNSSGSLDSTFQVGTGADNLVWTLAQQPDGKILAGGQFTRFNNIPRLGVVRLLNTSSTPFDFDGDSRADIGVVRPSTSDWYILRSSGGQTQQNFGLPEDVLAPADYDGDGKTDLGVFRPSTGTFWKTSSVNGGYSPTQWGTNGDIPRPSDYDGDGVADFIVYRPSNGVWYRLKSDGSQISIVPFGQTGDQPLTGDFDGDGKSDPAVFRPSNGTWWYLSSANGGGLGAPWGTTGDIPAPADYDGDGRTEFAEYRPSNGTWYIYNLATAGVTIVQFGLNGDRPVAADYDGDGRADVAVFRPSSGTWYVLQSTGGFFAAQFGTGTDLAIPNSFVP